MLLACAWLQGFSAADPDGVDGGVPGTVADSGRAQSVPDSATVPDDTLQSAADTSELRAKIPHLYEVHDRDFIAHLWRFTGRDGLPEDGEYQVLLLRDDSGSQAWLLREGTQIGKLPEWSVGWVGEKLRTGSGLYGGNQSRDVGVGLWRTFWNPGDRFQPFHWGTGLEASFGHAAGVFPRTSPQFERHLDFVFSQRPEPWLFMELGGHVSQYGGGLQRNLFNPNDNGADWNYWGKVWPWWHAALGVPGAKWEVALASRPFPQFYWLDPNAGEGAYKLGRKNAGNPVAPSEGFRDGALMRRWNGNENAPNNPGNISQALHFKAGVVGYSVFFDNDVYRSTIHQLLFDGLPAPFGQWGFGFVAADGAAHTRVRMDLFPWRTGFETPAGAGSLRAFFLRFDVAFRNSSTFHVGLATSVLLDGPGLRPGDKK